MRYRVEKDFVVQGYRCAILGHILGHRCGYVAIPKGHPFYKKHYDQINELGINIHGGWTYSESGDCGYPLPLDEELWWIGFDTAHYNDRKDLDLLQSFTYDDAYEKGIAQYFIDFEKRDTSKGEVRTLEYVEEQLVQAVNQIINAVETLEKFNELVKK